MAIESDKLDVILALIRQLEAAVLGLREVRKYVPKGVVAQEMLDKLIEEIEIELASIKPRMTQ